MMESNCHLAARGVAAVLTHHHHLPNPFWIMIPVDNNTLSRGSSSGRCKIPYNTLPKY